MACAGGSARGGGLPAKLHQPAPIAGGAVPHSPYPGCVHVSMLVRVCTPEADAYPCCTRP